MKSKISVLSSGYNVVWLAYTLHYVGLFYILTSSLGDRANEPFFNFSLPTNIIMNSTSLVLAVIGVLIAYRASRHNSRYWSMTNSIVQILMVFWIFGGSWWIFQLLTG